LVTKYFNNELDFEPGSKFRYSGLLGYILLGAILESISGKSYEILLKERILDPLGMKNTSYLDYRKLIKNHAEDYTRTAQGIEHRIQAYPIHADGSSGIVSTAGDMLLWDQALYSNDLLSNPFLEELFKPHVTINTSQFYGYGWSIIDLELAGEEERIFYHTGGGSCVIFRSTFTQQSVILLNNLPSSKLYDIGLEILLGIQNKE